MPRYERVVNRKIGDTTYYKDRITGTPPGIFDELGWEHGERLDFRIKNGEITYFKVKVKKQ